MFFFVFVFFFIVSVFFLFFLFLFFSFLFLFEGEGVQNLSQAERVLFLLHICISLPYMIFKGITH